MTTPLSRPYASIFGAPVLHEVDRRIFTLAYFTHCMACGFCADSCCNHGVDVDEAEMARLATLGPAFEAYVGRPAGEWFTAGMTEDGEFPSGRHARTAVAEGRCVFAARQTRGCAIHGWCLENGLDYHAYKPMVSVLFPLTFHHGVLMPSEEAIDGTLICSGQGPSLYDGVRDEVAHYFGADLVAELDALRPK